MEQLSENSFLPSGSLWAPLPIPAIKFLTDKGHKQEGRVLYALSLHLGKGLVAVFPSYPTVAKYSCVGENNLRACYNKLVFFGFISIEKRRVGKRNKNFYTILPKAWQVGPEQKKGVTGPQLNAAQKWMCRGCFEYVLPADAKFIKNKNWEGQPDDYWLHSSCVKYGNGRVEPESVGILMDRDNHLEWMEICRREELLKSSGESMKN
jgi:hypothetical protein